MFASIRSYRVDRAQRDEVVRRVDEGWIDALRAHRGVTYLVVATAPGELVSITSAPDEKTLSLLVEKSAEWVGAHLMDLDVTLLDERHGQVVSHLG